MLPEEKWGSSSSRGSSVMSSPASTPSRRGSKRGRSSNPQTPANPTESQWNPKKTTIENIQLPHTLLSRLMWRKIGSGRGMVSAYPRQLESLIRLAEAHAKVSFFNKVETIDVEEAKRLHREVLKQSATDPRTGIVDISILTTGINATAHKRKEEVAQALKKLIQSKGKTPALKYQQLFDDLRAQSDAAVTKGRFEEALRALADDDFLTVTGKTIKIAVMKC